MKIEQFNQTDAEKWATLYADVFADEPWREFTRCSQEVPLSYYGRESNPGERCPRFECSGLLELAYPVDQTAAFLLKEAARPSALAQIAFDEDQMIGFALGFSYPAAKFFAREKYKTPDARKAVEYAVTTSGLTDQFFYISECGVRQDYRGRGLSNTLTGSLVDEARKLQLPGLMRTNQKSPMVAVARRFGMQQILGPKVNYNPSTRMINASEEAIMGRWDMENKDRVLFVLPK